MNEWIPNNDATLFGFARSAWMQIKNRHKKHICFFYFRWRLATFSDDALEVSRILSIPTGIDSNGTAFTALALNDDLVIHFKRILNVGWKIAVGELNAGHKQVDPRQMELF